VHPSLTYSLLSLCFLLQTDLGDSPADYFSQHKILPRDRLLSYLVGIEGKRRSPRPPCQNSLPSLLLRPPTPSPTPNGWTPSCWPPSLTPPRRDSTSHPTPAQDIAMATEDARSRQSATGHPLHCHLATSLALDPWINSMSQFCPRPTVRRTPTMADQRRHAVQSAQRMPSVPVQLHPA
jgi:hypothetical protein